MTVSRASASNGRAFRDPAFAASRDVPIHRWVPWVAGCSKHFVEDALNPHAPEPGVVLDPFAGVGTALAETDHAGREAIGFEIHPYDAFVSEAKLKAHRVDLDLRAPAGAGEIESRSSFFSKNGRRTPFGFSRAA